MSFFFIKNFSNSTHTHARKKARQIEPLDRGSFLLYEPNSSSLLITHARVESHLPLFRAPARRVLGFKASYRRHSSKKPRHASALSPHSSTHAGTGHSPRRSSFSPSAPLSRIYGLSLDRPHNPEIRPRITVEIVRGEEGGERERERS